MRDGNSLRRNNRRTLLVQSSISFLLVSLSFLMLAGCRGKDRLSVYPVHGRVMYGGQGVPKATVIFFPSDEAVDKAKKLRPFAYCDGEGNFDLKTYVDDDGAPPGKYRVSIIAVSKLRTGSTKDQPAGEPESINVNAVPIPPEISKKYGNVDTAGIEVTVREEENKLDPFVLSKGDRSRAQAAAAIGGSAVSSRN